MSAQKPSLERLIEFHKLLTSFAEVERVVYLKRRGTIELESDTEHSYNLAMMAWFLADSFPNLRAERMVLLALAHDIVEIHAGDTFIFADQGELDSKAEREAAAQKQLAQDWSDFPELHAAIEEYEKRKTEEAKFVYALDKLMPMITVYLNDGLTWREKQMELARLNEEKILKMSVSPDILAYWSEMHELLKRSPELFPR